MCHNFQDYGQQASINTEVLLVLSVSSGETPVITSGFLIENLSNQLDFNRLMIIRAFIIILGNFEGLWMLP